MLRPIPLTNEQKLKLIEMCNAFFPEHGEPQLLSSYCSTPTDATGSPYVRWYVKKQDTVQLIEIHWFELIFMFLARKVASEYAKNLYGTDSYARFLVTQKLTNELELFNPIDSLHDIWKNPSKYAPSL